MGCIPKAEKIPLGSLNQGDALRVNVGANLIG